MSTIFLSYPSSLEETAARLELSLTGEGHAVFRDRSALPPGESFDARIRAAVEESDLFVFLITPESVSPGRYTLTELKFVEQRWGHPAGRVLPVLAEATPTESIPAFLRAVTILKPHGNLVAEVAAAVARLSAPWWRRMLEPRRLVPAAIAALLLAGSAWLVLPSYLERRQQSAEVAALVDRSRSQIEAGNYADAWKQLEQANAVAPASREVLEAQEQLAMKLLRGAGLSYSSGGRDGSEDLVKRTLPVLARGSAGAKGERLANLLAHMGWADYLRGGRAGSSGLDPVTQYRSALEADPANVYAHAMWGFELLRERGSSAALAEARRHFSAALETGREREYLRYLEVSALLQTYTNVWIENPERQREVIRVVNAMRTGKETRPRGGGRARSRARCGLSTNSASSPKTSGRRFWPRCPRRITSPPFAGCSRKTTVRPTGESTGSSSTCSFSPRWRSTATIAPPRWLRIAGYWASSLRRSTTAVGPSRWSSRPMWPSAASAARRLRPPSSPRSQTLGTQS